VDEGAVLAGADDPHRVYKERIQPTKLALQLKYYRERTLLTDLRIIIYTVVRIVRKGWVPPELVPYGTP
jgi:lipopolysaccharide/colanic/teichoic acid biosynthesis glycosyltransferase